MARLVITEMVLEDFKSYAGAQRIGPFHKVRSSVESEFKCWRSCTVCHGSRAATAPAWRDSTPAAGANTRAARRHLPAALCGTH